MRSQWAIVFTILFCLLAPKQGQADQNDDKVRAQRLLKRGDKHFQKKEFKRALKAYQDAYEAYASPKIFYPIAQTEEKLGRPMEALLHYEQMLSDAADLGEEVRAQARTRIAELEKQIVVVDFDVEPEGTWIVVDDVEMGQAPLGQVLRLPEGEHVYEFRNEGYESVQKTVNLSKGQRLKEVVRLNRKGVTKKVVPKKPVKRVIRTSRRTGVWVGAFATVVLGASAGALGLWTLSKHDVYTDGGMPLENRRNARDSGKTMAWVSDGLWLATLGAAAFTTYWYYHTKPVESLVGSKQRAMLVPFATENSGGMIWSIPF